MADAPQLRLLHTASAGDLNAVQEALATDRVSINAIDERGVTALGLAVAAGHARVAELLITAGANTDNIGNSRDSALMYAIRHRRFHLVDVLLAAGVDVNVVNSDADTALLIACEANLCGVVAKLLRAGADAAYARPINHESALTIAAAGSFEDVVAALLSVTNSENNSIQWDFERALTFAVDAGIIRRLLAAGARLDQVNIGSLPLLIRAVQHRRVDVVRVLLGAGDNVNQTNNYQRHASALMLALPCPQITEMLLTVDRIDIEQMDDDGATAFMHAAEQGYIAAVHRLLAAGASANHVNLTM